MESLASTWRRYIDLEAEEEQLEIDACLNQLSARELERRERAVLNLIVEHVKFGWFGKLLLTFKSATSNRSELVSFRSGEILGIYKHSKAYGSPINAVNKQLTTGVVHYCTDEKIKLSLEQTQYQELLEQLNAPDTSGCRFSLALAGSDVTYKRRKNLIDRIQRCIEHASDPAQQALFTVLVGGSDLARQPPKSDVKLLIADEIKDLNSSQQEAVLACLQGDPCNVIYGPPGTGKTTTVVALIKCMVRLGYKVLATGPSNTAVDNMMERCEKMRIVRLGHPSRVSPILHNNIFEKKALRSDANKICEDIKSELEEVLKIKKEGKLKGSRELTQRLGSEASGSNRKAVRAAAHREVGMLHKELRQREKQVALEILDSSDVVFCTCVGADGELLNQYLKDRQLFDFVIIDEAGQGAEIDCWMPILRGKRLILAGDPQQLGATTKSKANLEAGPPESLLEKTMSYHPENTRFLSIQYRMNEKIMLWSSRFFYGGRLVASECCKDRRFPQHTPLQWIDTSDTGTDCFREDPSPSQEQVSVTSKSGEVRPLNTSKSNVAEALVCIRVLERVARGLEDYVSIGVITPYKEQIMALTQLMRKSVLASRPIRISTVDGFQGQERDIILCSTVRSNPGNVIGFLMDSRRLNVAVTRAKRLLIMVGDSVCTSASSEATKFLYEHIKAVGEIHSALEFVTVQEIEDIKIEHAKSYERQLQECQASPKVAETPATPSATLKKSSKKSKKSSPSERARKSMSKTHSLDDTRMEHLNTPAQEQEDAWLSEQREQLIALTASNPTFKYSDLSSYQRMKVHELADSLGLKHYSVTQADSSRLLIVELPKKELISSDITRYQSPKRSPREAESAISAEPPPVDSGGSQVLPLRSREKPRSLSCSSSASRASLSPRSSTTPSLPRRKSKSSRKKTDKKKKERAIIVDEDEDELLDKMLAEAVAQEGRCNFEGCSERANILDLKCRHCCLKYCYEHGLPEAHGCGEAARQWARKEKPLSAQEHANVEKRLKAKVEGQKSKRKSKKTK